MKKRVNLKKCGIIGILLCMLFVSIIPTTTIKAETLEDKVTQTVAFGESETLTLKYNDPVVLKVVMKEKGSFELDFSPKSLWIQGELYDENSNFLGTWKDNKRSCVTSMTLDPGTYYARLWITSQFEEGTYTYFARQIPSEEVSLEICINLKKGKSVQLGTIFNNSKDKKVKWSSSKKSVATVSSSGKVTAKKKGTATIKVYNSSGLVAKIKVKVTS